MKAPSIDDKMQVNCSALSIPHATCLPGLFFFFFFFIILFFSSAHIFRTPLHTMTVWEYISAICAVLSLFLVVINSSELLAPLKAWIGRHPWFRPPPTTNDTDSESVLKLVERKEFQEFADMSIKNFIDIKALIDILAAQRDMKPANSE
ncbi:hypothetical protein F4809DRAFT_282581 [Biscogniauxia mediterranea]|nr:hypothetical protein F4809DRAFT_282581 [Biscogniauxia mediterranea]